VKMTSGLPPEKKNIGWVNNSWWKNCKHSLIWITNVSPRSSSSSKYDQPIIDYIFRIYPNWNKSLKHLGKSASHIHYNRCPKRTCVYCRFLLHIAFTWGKIATRNPFIYFIVKYIIKKYLISDTEVLCKSGYIL